MCAISCLSFLLPFLHWHNTVTLGPWVTLAPCIEWTLEKKMLRNIINISPMTRCSYRVITLNHFHQHIWVLSWRVIHLCIVYHEQVNQAEPIPYQVKPQLISVNLMAPTWWLWTHNCWFHQENSPLWIMTSVEETLCPAMWCCHSSNCMNSCGDHCTQ